MSAFTYPKLSVVIEWENTRNSNKSRGQEMLRRLFRQLTAVQERFPSPPEVILVHDAKDGRAAGLLADIAAGQSKFCGSLRTFPCAGLDYYDQKNLGALEARGDAILFVDSDVIPEEGWVEALLQCYSEEEADVVAGTTYIHGSSLYERAFSLFWFFPMEADCRGLSRTRAESFFANNVLFRAATFRALTFPDAPLVRGRCWMLADKMSKSGQLIINEPRARTQHPAPNGLKHFVCRALCEGQDNAQSLGRKGRLITAFNRFVGHVIRSCKKIAVRYPEVRISRSGVLAAMFIAVAYYGVALCGELITAVYPQFVRRNLRV
jgi:glycosyltransferase involved in cell wall biosynthesis